MSYFPLMWTKWFLSCKFNANKLSYF